MFFYQKKLDSFFYFVIAKYAGNLEEFVRNNKKLSTEHKKSIAVQLVRGLQYLYQHDIAHRDLKPKVKDILVLLLEYTCNIYGSCQSHCEDLWLICRVSFSPWTDFGFSRPLKEDEVTDSRVETPGYAVRRIMISPKAPEVKKEPYTNRVDLWSMGVVLFWLDTKKRVPLDQNKIEDSLSQCIPEFQGLLSHLLQIDPTKRSWDNLFNHSFGLAHFDQSIVVSFEPHNTFTFSVEPLSK